PCAPSTLFPSTTLFRSIGTEVSERALALGMKVMAYDPLLNEERAKRLGVILATIEEICRQADFITVHTPLTRETEGLIGEREFKDRKSTRLNSSHVKIS